MRRILILICVLIAFNSLYSQENRLALVIGNSAYEYGGILKNPVNDAYAMKRALSDAGFEVLEYMDASGTDVNIVILDAPSGTLIAYATAPGRTASDGTGMNGLYTEAILESMEVPGLTILQMFQNVRSLVNERSNKLQTPWEATSMVGDFYLMKGENILEREIFDTHNEEALTGEFRNDRDGEIYQWIRLGDQVWMAENVNHYIKDYGHYCYDNNESNCDSYGRLYQWNLAIEACPSGWHLPSDDEWKELEIYFGMSRVEADKEGWRGETEVNQSGIVKFVSTFPGYRKTEDQLYYDLSAITYFWTSSGLSSGDAWFRAIIKGRTGVNRKTSNKLYANSVRCLKN